MIPKDLAVISPRSKPSTATTTATKKSLLFGSAKQSGMNPLASFSLPQDTLNQKLGGACNDFVGVDSRITNFIQNSGELPDKCKQFLIIYINDLYGYIGHLLTEDVKSNQFKNAADFFSCLAQALEVGKDGELKTRFNMSLELLGHFERFFFVNTIFNVNANETDGGKQKISVHNFFESPVKTLKMKNFKKTKSVLRQKPKSIRISPTKALRILP